MGYRWNSSAGPVLGCNITQLDPDTGAKIVSSTSGINQPSSVAVDSSNNVWVTSYQGAGPVASGGGVTELSAVNHTPLSPPETGFTDDGGGGLAHAVGIAIDPSGNVWIPADYGLFEIVGAAAPVKTPLLGPPQLP